MGSESAEWAIDSEAMRAREIIVLVTYNLLVKNIENKKILASESSTLILFCRRKAGAIHYQWAITYSLVVAQPIRKQH